MYTYPGGTRSIWNVRAHLLPLRGTGGIPGGCVVGSVVCCLSCSGEGAPVPFSLQHVWGFCAVPFSQG